MKLRKTEPEKSIKNYRKKSTCTDNVVIKGFSYNYPSVPAGWGIKLRRQGPHHPPKKSYCDPLGLICLSKKEAYEYGEDDLTLMRMVYKKPKE